MTSPQTLATSSALPPGSRLLSAVNTATLLLGLVALVFLLHLGSKPEFGFIFAGAFLLHLGLSPTRRELGLVLAFAVGFAALYLLAATNIDPLQVDHWWVSRFASIGAALGCGSVSVLGLDAFWSSGERARRARLVLRRAAIIPVFGIIAAIAMGFVSKIPATTFDLYLYSFDDSLGFQASFWCGRLFRNFHWIQQIASLVYDALPVLPPLVLAMSWRQRRRLPFDPLTAFVAAAVVCFCLYQVCPGTAPAAVFHDSFPDHPPAASTLQIARIAVPDSPRNAIPSMHVTWTLLAWWCALSLSRWMKIFSTLFLGWTLLATLGLGEHYLCDLMVASIFTVAISAACATQLGSSPVRRQVLALSSILTLAWLLALREGALVGIPHAAAWLLLILTVTLGANLQRRLIAAVGQVPDLPLAFNEPPP